MPFFFYLSDLLDFWYQSSPRCPINQLRRATDSETRLHPTSCLSNLFINTFNPFTNLKRYSYPLWHQDCFWRFRRTPADYSGRYTCLKISILTLFGQRRTWRFWWFRRFWRFRRLPADPGGQRQIWRFRRTLPLPFSDKDCFGGSGGPSGSILLPAPYMGYNTGARIYKRSPLPCAIIQVYERVCINHSQTYLISLLQTW